ncbi:MAG: thiamine phosphate synthase [Methanobrevibacter sp.]|nr:thiamine phosphate synthase [Candidatus Methanovirga meridionalis]
MLIVVTNKNLVKNDFLIHIEEIIKAKPFKIILREKELNRSQYYNLAKKVIAISNRYNVEIAIHNNIGIGKSLNIESIHLPFKKFIENKDNLDGFKSIGVSIHSLEEAKSVEENNGDYILVGHIFKTQSKKNLPPRGLKFLKEIKTQVKIPIYAIGGINLKTINSVLKTGVDGVAIMSDLMNSNDPYKKVLKYKNVVHDFKIR